MEYALPPLEAMAVGFALAYLVLAIRQNVWCWPAALVSVALSLLLFYESRLYMESALQLFYFGMGVYGWYQWVRGGDRGAGVRVRWWPARAHLTALASIAGLTGLLGWTMSMTDAAFPFVDSFTTVAAIVTTYMVARKIIENWFYWFVIDAVSVYIYWQRGLLLYAALFVLYLVLIVLGYTAWLRDWRAQAETARA